MNVALLLKEIDALKEAHQRDAERIDRLRDLVAAAAADGDDRPFMTQAEYARRIGKAEDTIRKWVRAGLPHRRRGRTIDIDVRAADRWELKEVDDRSATRAVHRGERT